MARWAPVLTALLVLLSGGARAECQPDGIQFFPLPGSVVPINARFILEGVGADQHRVSALVGKILDFRAERDVVRAKVLKAWKSEVNRTAVLIAPTALFKKDMHYELLLNDVLPNALLLGGGAERPEWEVSAPGDDKSRAAPDDTAPVWRKRPAVSEG